VGEALLHEKQLGFLEPDPYAEFEREVHQRREELLSFATTARDQAKLICGAGALTKGNTILRLSGFNSSQNESIPEINSDKFGRVTPRSEIPIVSQPEVLRTHPDYLIVLPLQFCDFFLASDLFAGQTLLIPFPKAEIVTRH